MRIDSKSKRRDFFHEHEKSLELKLEIDESTRVGRVTERGNLGGQLNRLAVANAN